MDMTYCYLAVVAAALLFSCIRAALKKRKAQMDRAFQQKLETVLLPRETVKAVCRQKKGRWVLTSKRILTETGKGFHALDLKTIKSAFGSNAAGNRTTVPGKMVTLTIRAGEDLVLHNTGEDFEPFARELTAWYKKRKEQKRKP